MNEVRACYTCKQPKTGSHKSYCKACGRDVQGPRSKRGVADHDHVTGVFRGIICNGCNVALGMLGDDPVHLRALAEYLESRKVAAL